MTALTETTDIGKKFVFAIRQGRRNFYCPLSIHETFGNSEKPNLGAELAHFQIGPSQNGIRYQQAGIDFLHEDSLAANIQIHEASLAKNLADTSLRHRITALREVQGLFDEIRAGTSTIEQVNERLKVTAKEFRDFYLEDPRLTENLMDGVSDRIFNTEPT